MNFADCLILQGENAEERQRLAQCARAKCILEPAPHITRCEGIECTANERKMVREQAHALTLDANFVPSDLKLSDFGLLAMDMDSTLITIECIDEIADWQGLKSEVAAITEAAMRGELDFPGSLRQRVGLLVGLPESALQTVYEERLRLSPGAENLLAAARAAGLKTLLVSGGFTFFAEKLKALLGLDFKLANTLEIIDGKLTGRMLGSIVDAHEKKRMVEHTCATLGIAPSQAIVAGDGANDLEMMSIAGLSVAYHAKPVVREKADVALNHHGLDALLNLFSPH